MNLTGKLLIAMPGMGDPRFEKSVIYMCDHTGDGAMGLIVNKPATDIGFADLLGQLGIERGDSWREPRIYFGGPVEHARGFVLHSSEYRSAQGENATLRVDDSFSMTATLDILSDIAQGAGPAECMLALGYSGWGPGQLEAEIGENGWLMAEASPEIVFARDNGLKWSAALKTLGIDPLLLSSAAGHA
ncbi:YqgE/AlgH family protein [Qingshengfaniella alkalisoli]|nr:YqgE/AlgH family protein [Qingshengfaniella alkalisoli]